jgi:plasmid stability protein
MSSSIVIRNLDADVESRIRLRAKVSGRTIEAEAMEILRQALSEPIVRVNSRDLGQSIHARFAALGGLEMHQPRLVATRPSELFE